MCSVIAKGNLNGIEITVGATNFDFIGGSSGAAETEAIIYGVQHAIDNQTPFFFGLVEVVKECLKVQLLLLE